MGNIPGVPSSSKDDWRTPKKLFRELEKQHGPFTLDAAASDNNHLCDRYFTKKDNALIQRWEGFVWVNPPYGNMLAKFVKKAYYESEHCKVVMLIPVSTDTSYWHKYILDNKRTSFKPGIQVQFLPGRIKFIDPTQPITKNGRASFPSALVIFDRRNL